MEESKKCPRGKSENLDSGCLGVGASGIGASFGYLSDKQGLLSRPVPIGAKICLNCGYMELYGDVESLRRKVKK